MNYSAFGALAFAALITIPGIAQSADCAARVSLPWETAGPGYSGDAIVRGPDCANAVVLFVARRPGGELRFDDEPDKVVPGNAPIATEIKPAAEVPALASATDGAAMTAALPAALAAWLRAQAMPQKPTNRAELIAAGPTKGDCSVSDTLPWTAAGRGYLIDVFSDGTDCLNAATALVIRAPDGRPLYSAATPGFIVDIYNPDLKTRADMKKALTRIETMTEDTTGKLPAWPEGQAEREITRGDFTTTVAEPFDRASWNALRDARRPMLPVDYGIESAAFVVLMPDGRVIEVGRSQQN
jgi:hypothetical protein